MNQREEYISDIVLSLRRISFFRDDEELQEFEVFLSEFNASNHHIQQLLAILASTGDADKADTSAIEIGIELGVLLRRAEDIYPLFQRYIEDATGEPWDRLP